LGDEADDVRVQALGREVGLDVGDEAVLVLLELGDSPQGVFGDRHANSLRPPPARPPSGAHSRPSRPRRSGPSPRAWWPSPTRRAAPLAKVRPGPWRRARGWS